MPATTTAAVNAPIRSLKAHVAGDDLPAPCRLSGDEPSALQVARSPRSVRPGHAKGDASVPAAQLASLLQLLSGAGIEALLGADALVQNNCLWLCADLAGDLQSAADGDLIEPATRLAAMLEMTYGEAGEAFRAHRHVMQRAFLRGCADLAANIEAAHFS